MYHMPVITTLSFNGRTEEAINFYRDALDAEIVYLLRFRDSPEQAFTMPGMEDLIFHATFRIGGTELMASDVGAGQSDAETRFQGFALALQLNTPVRARQIFDALAQAGDVLIPLAESAFTSLYGIVTDRFGITWKINVQRVEP